MMNRRFEKLAQVIKVDWLHKLRGTVVCIASGPSLTEADCVRVRASGLPTIVTNTTYQRCPWATVLLGHDWTWWQVHHREVRRVFRGHCVTGEASGRRFGAQYLGALKLNTFRNAGCAAISLAVLAGARRVILLGYDGRFAADGRTHWHGDHPVGLLGNCGSLPKWPERFAAVAVHAREQGVEVLNASRETAHEAFARVALEDVLPIVEQRSAA
jgi:hypothetical protein